MLKIGHINITFSLLIITNNVFILISRSADVYEYFVYVSPFIFSALVFVLAKDNIVVNSYLLLIIGSCCCIFGSFENIAGAYLVTVAIHINRNRRFLVISLSTLYSTLVIKNAIIGLKNANIFNAILLYTFVIVVYFILFREKPQIIETDNLSPEQLEILQLLVEGYIPKEIQHKLSDYVSVETIRKRIERMRNQFNVKTNEELIYKLSQLGHFNKKYDKYYNK